MHAESQQPKSYSWRPGPLTFIMLLRRGIPDLASIPTDVLAASRPAWLPGTAMEPDPTMFADIPQSPFENDASQWVLPAVPSSPGTGGSPVLDGGSPLSFSPDSAMGTLSHGPTLAVNLRCGERLGDVFGFPSIPCLAYRRGVITCAENQSISSFVAEAHQVASSPCIVRCKQITAIIVLTLKDKRSNRYSASCSSKKRVEWTSTRLTIKWFRWHWKRMLRWMQYSSCMHLRRMHIERATWAIFFKWRIMLINKFLIISLLVSWECLGHPGRSSVFPSVTLYLPNVLVAVTR